MTKEERIQKVQKFEDYLDGLRKRPHQKPEIHGLAEERNYSLTGDWKQQRRGAHFGKGINPRVAEEILRGPPPNKY